MSKVKTAIDHVERGETERFKPPTWSRRIVFGRDGARDHCNERAMQLRVGAEHAVSRPTESFVSKIGRRDVSMVGSSGCRACPRRAGKGAKHPRSTRARPITSTASKRINREER
ncbi:hypothetical protein [Burkholderia gladioli]|uniref:hypothetical protein n=1 Tax=Burkholderia gladioli TaxID=28095 RepID=UPI0011D1AFF9|nr:hypothetical protein [Burkholderia gladioli]MBW5280470.1 hypothetical protein [Burkholderia gladioli]